MRRQPHFVETITYVQTTVVLADIGNAAVCMATCTLWLLMRLFASWAAILEQNLVIERSNHDVAVAVIAAVHIVRAQVVAGTIFEKGVHIVRTV